MDKVKAFIRRLNDARKAFRAEHKLWHDGACLALAFLVLGFVWGRAFGAVYNCAGTIPGTLTCTEQGAPGGGAPPVVPPVTPPASDFAGCPAGAITHHLPAGVEVFDSETVAPFGSQPLSVRFVATSTSNRAVSVVEFRGGPVTREVALSTKPCDFSAASAVKNALGVGAVATSTSPGFSYRVGASGVSVFGVAPNAVLYLNVRNVGCPGDCGVRVTVRR